MDRRRIRDRSGHGQLPSFRTTTAVFGTVRPPVPIPGPRPKSYSKSPVAPFQMRPRRHGRVTDSAGNSLSPWVEPCESESSGALFAVLVVSAQPQDGGRCLFGPILRNEVEVVIRDVEHVETAAVGRVRVVDRALGVLYKDADPGGLGGKRPGAAVVIGRLARLEVFGRE